MAEATDESPLRRGIGEGIPVVLSFLPYGLILGATIAAADIDFFTAWLTSPVIFAGASQLATVDLLGAGATAGVVLATVAVLNFRHVMYSAGLAPYFEDVPAWWRYVAPTVLNDVTYARAMVVFEELPPGPARRRYYLGLGLVLYVAWTASTTAGMLVGAALPASWQLDVAVPLMFIALLMPTVTDRPTIAAASVAAVVAVVGRDIPLHLGLIVAAIAGIATGILLDPGYEPSSPPPPAAEGGEPDA